MKSEHQNLTPTELALLTWHGGNDLEHISIKLAGEIGELLDLYGKHKYKPGFNWFRCKCGHEHTFEGCTEEIWSWDSENGKEHLDFLCTCKSLTPLVLDEMGDIWFYLRILSYYTNFPIAEFSGYFENTLDALVMMYRSASNLLTNLKLQTYILEGDFDNLTVALIWFLEDLGYGIEDLTRLNYIKLNSEESHHGWKK